MSSLMQSTSVVIFVAVAALALPQDAQRIVLNDAVILVDSGDASYVQYGARDLGSYLTEITGKPVPVVSSLPATKRAKAIIAIGEKMAQVMGAEWETTWGMRVRSYVRWRGPGHK